MYKKSFFLQSFFSLTALLAQDVIHLVPSQTSQPSAAQVPSPIVFVSNTGSALALLNENEGQNNNILSAFMPAQSNTFNPPEDVYTVGSKKSASYTNTAMNSSGEGIIVFNIQNTDPDDFYSKRFQISAQDVTFESLPSLTVSGGVYDAAVGIDASGNVVCAWKDGSATTAGTKVYASCLHKADHSWSTPQLVATPSNGRACNAVRVAINASGEGIILWNDFTINGDYGQYYSKRISLKSGTFFLSDTIMKLPSDTIDNKKQEDDVGLGVDALGNVIVAWRYGQSTTLAPIQASVLVAGAGSWSQLQTLSDGNYNHNVTLSIDPSGFGAVAWNQGAGGLC